MIAPPAVRAAKALVAKHRKEQRKARAPRVVPDAKGQREPRIIDKPYLAFLRRQPCAVASLNCLGPVEAAHIRFGRPGAPNPGLQAKSNDRRAVPLCAGHHRLLPDAQHKAGERAWWAARGIDPDELAVRLGEAFAMSGQVERRDG